MEKGETEEETARREAYEETGLKNLVFLPGFRRVNIYPMFRGSRRVERHVIFFLTESKSGEIKLSHEHTTHEWLDFDTAIRRVRFSSLRAILAAAAQRVDPSFKWKASENTAKKLST